MGQQLKTPCLAENELVPNMTKNTVFEVQVAFLNCLKTMSSWKKDKICIISIEIIEYYQFISDNSIVYSPRY